MLHIRNHLCVCVSVRLRNRKTNPAKIYAAKSIFDVFKCYYSASEAKVSKRLEISSVFSLL